MKALVLKQFGSVDQINEEELPKPKMGRSELRVKVAAAGFNPLDTKIRKGKIPLPLPLVLGADFSGVVDGVGDEFGEFSIGDEVFGLGFGPSSNGSYAEYLTLPTQFVVKKPKNLSLVQAAAIPCTYLTAFQALMGTGVLQKDRPIFIGGGSGGVGSAAIALAKCYGAGPIFTLSGSEQSTQYLIDQFHLSPDKITSYKGVSQEELVEKILAKNGNHRFYLTLDFVGGEVKRLCNALCDYNAHLVSIVAEEENLGISAWGREQGSLFQRSVSLHMLNVTTRAYSRDSNAWMAYKVQLKNLVKLFEEGSLLPPKTEVVGTFSKETVKLAHDRLEEGHAQGKLVMSF